MLRASVFAFVVVSCSSLQAADWGSFSGRFVFDGTPPAPTPLVVTKDPEFCGKHKLVDESVVVNPDNKGIANVIVYLYTRAGDNVPVHDSYDKSAQDKVRLDNDKCRFNPHVLLVRTSQTLLVGNLDAIGHNAKVDTLDPANTPANPMIPSGGVAEHRFSAPERLPVSVSCSIHPWMSARVVVKDHPYMAATDKDGKFEIKNVPAGEWTFQLWHESMGYVKEGQVNGKKVSWSKGRVKQKIASGDNSLGEVLLSPKAFK